MDYNDIKQAAKELGCSITDLIALAPQNDPFYVGTKGEHDKARWFADLWRRFGYGSGVHLRRVHYQLVSQDPPIVKPNGTVYENTENDWSYLAIAAKCARYLGLVAPEAFVDRRNPSAILHASYGQDPEPGYWISGTWYGNLEIDFPELPSVQVDGYEGNLQPYHLEIWVEKTTMNDVLEPLCSRYGANLITGAGELSITAAVDLIERVQRAARPCRIFYVSDFDPAGFCMPVSVARKLEFFVKDRGLDQDIRLEPIALTRDQVIAYRLPRTPIKESELRKGAFEDVHGAGAVELDAIEALHPGELQRIMEGAILGYYDQEIAGEARAQKAELAEALANLEADALADIQPEIDALRQEFAETIKDLQARLHDLHPRIVERLEGIDVDLGDYPLPEGRQVQETDGTLFDSTRDYFEQLGRYKAHQGGD